MFYNLPPATRALLVLNVVVYLLQLLLPARALSMFMLWPLDASGALAYSPYGFWPWQLLTYGFMHGGVAHLLFNMLALVMFGAPLEQTWSQRRFLTYFLVCVVGAGLCQLLVVTWSLQSQGQLIQTLGASGGVFGLLLAYGMLFPNQRVMLLFPPIPMKARTLVFVYGVISLLFGVSGTQSGVAHFAHLGGMLFGWLVIRYWRGQPPFNGGRRRWH